MWSRILPGTKIYSNGGNGGPLFILSWQNGTETTTNDGDNNIERLFLKADSLYINDIVDCRPREFYWIIFLNANLNVNFLNLNLVTYKLYW
jgi:hypothetical protein